MAMERSQTPVEMNVRRRLGQASPSDSSQFVDESGSGDIFSVAVVHYTWQMNLSSEDVTTHIKDYDEFSRILEGIEFPDLIAGEHTLRRLKLLVFEAMLWYDKAPTQSKYNDFRLSNLAGLIEWISR